MKRLDWVQRLWETIEAHRLLPFRWAGRDDSHDCCSFVAACLDAMTDGNYLERLLANYTDEATALAFIAANGGLAQTIDLFLVPKRTSFMQRGDVALVMRDGREFLGVCAGAIVISAGPDGLVSNPRTLAIKAWGI